MLRHVRTFDLADHDGAPLDPPGSPGASLPWAAWQAAAVSMLGAEPWQVWLPVARCGTTESLHLHCQALPGTAGATDTDGGSSAGCLAEAEPVRDGDVVIDDIGVGPDGTLLLVVKRKRMPAAPYGAALGVCEPGHGESHDDADAADAAGRAPVVDLALDRSGDFLVYTEMRLAEPSGRMGKGLALVGAPWGPVTSEMWPLTGSVNMSRLPWKVQVLDTCLSSLGHVVVLTADQRLCFYAMHTASPSLPARLREVGVADLRHACRAHLDANSNARVFLGSGTRIFGMPDGTFILFGNSVRSENVFDLGGYHDAFLRAVQRMTATQFLLVLHADPARSDGRHRGGRVDFEVHDVDHDVDHDIETARDHNRTPQVELQVVWSSVLAERDAGGDAWMAAACFRSLPHFKILPAVGPRLLISMSAPPNVIAKEPDDDIWGTFALDL
jgi:hypothetical protein